MSTERRHVKLGYSIWASGAHPAGWRLPEANAHGTFDPGFILRTIRTAERGLLDFYFIGDRVVGLPSSQYESPNEVLRPEALTLASFVAAVTTHIGIVTTVNTTYAEPYTLARATAQLDHLSRGRIAWNIVTGKNEEAAGNFGREEHWDAAKRYAWTGEFVEVVKGLWDSWEDDALVGDKATGQFIDESKVHAIGYRGEHFSVDGPLNIARPPQGHVPILHAGSSEESHEFGAEHADIRFIMLQDTARAKAYYQDLQRRRLAHGHPEGQQTVTSLPVYVAGTAREAHEKFRQIQHLTVAEANLAPLSEALGVDLTGRRLDTPISDVAELANLEGRPALILDRARTAYDDESPTLREVALFYKRTHGKQAAVGDASDVADYIEEQFHERTTDGFIVFSPYLPGPLDAFVDLVIPELQRRDLFKTEYGTPRTFRELFGLPKPENQFTVARRAAVA
ncbi:NtaA/DmoA family FMN-dependent monooxygenase [Agromyces intestinalis]|uniref:NtaA/DmoA family FMN-dependent monooxygenase n=1 Tax=Agromyces intestinalis TaxID=2592652 RepID=A0A5C1YGU8_9MICO|nr:NtaA/DmoA family FMN-dependent monooxygenase [Agromyces intestinalis]QEO14838.1 NtaA/DmoA family FMN-dependent monooxygenase [Agromyces intestinalis]